MTRTELINRLVRIVWFGLGGSVPKSVEYRWRVMYDVVLDMAQSYGICIADIHEPVVPSMPTVISMLHVVCFEYG